VCGKIYTVACSLCNTGDNVVWAFGGVYGPNDDRNRTELWDELAGRCHGVLEGDFNVVRFQARGQGLPAILQQW
jgi:hypothetical protein